MNLLQDLPRAQHYFTDLQSRIVGRLEAIDGAPFRRDEWQRTEGGSGTSCILEEGKVFERGGVNFSHVKGERLPPPHGPPHRGPRPRRTGCALTSDMAPGLEGIIETTAPAAITAIRIVRNILFWAEVLA